MKHVTGGLAALVLIASAVPGVALAAPTDTTGAAGGTGLDLAQSRAHFANPQKATTFGAMQAVEPMGAVPASHSLVRHALTPGNQGRTNSCVGWAIGYSGYGVLMNQQQIAGAPMAPMYLYAQLVRGNDVGTWGSAALQMATEQGIDTRAHYTPGDYDYWTQPNQSHRANAAKYRLSGYQALPLQGEAAKQAIKKAISAGSPVPIGMQIRQSFNDVSPQNPWYQAAGGVTGGHETTIVAYDAQGVTVENSWGDNWGDGGFYKMPWDFVNWGDLTEMHAMGAVVGGNPLPSPDETPTPEPTPEPGTNAVANGGFEDGQAPWEGNQNRVSTNPAQPARTGNGKLWLGGVGRANTTYMGQKVTVPANGTLTFWIHVDTDETEGRAYDTARVDLVDDNGAGPVLAKFSNLDAKDGYQKQTVDLSTFAGRSMWLRFAAFEDDNTRSGFVFDDVSVA